MSTAFSSGLGGRSAISDAPAQVTQAHLRDLNMSLALASNPWLADAPDALVQIADSGLDPFSITTNAGAIGGMQHVEQMVGAMGGLSDPAQRSIWNGLTEQQQRAANSMGYAPPEEGGMFDFLDPVFDVAGPVARAVTRPIKTVASPVLGIGLDAMTWIGDVPAHFYRSIRQMEGWQQWIALGAAVGAVALTGGLAAAAGAGMLTAGTLTGAAGATAASFLTGASSLGSLGVLGALGGTALAAGTASTALTAVTNPTEWWDLMNPFDETGVGGGERIFLKSAQKKAMQTLGQADHLQALARDIAAEMDVMDLAIDFAGVRDATNINVMSESIERVAAGMAEPGTMEYQEIYQGLVKLTQEPEFRQAIDELQGGKISFGRDVASVAGLEQGDRFYGAVSGSMDALWLFAMDPLLGAGKVGRFARARRRGMTGVLQDRSVLERMTAIVNEDKTAGAMVDQVMKSVGEGRFDLMPKAWRSNFNHMTEYRRGQVAQGKTEWGRKEFLEYIADGDGMRRVLEGKGTLRGHEALILDTANDRRGMALLAKGIREFQQGMTDVELDRAIKKIADKTGTTDQYAKMRAVGAGDEATQIRWEASRFTDDEIKAMQETVGYVAGQATGQILRLVPVAGSSFNRFVGSISTMIPANDALNLVGDGASTDIARFIETMGRHFNMNSVVRKEWLNTTMNQGTIGQRRQVLMSFMRSTFDATGVNALPETRALAEEFLHKYKQAYGFGGLDSYDINNVEKIIGWLPQQHSSVMFVMPNLKEMQKVISRGIILKNAARVIDSDVLANAMSRFIKPGWLLRIGFIPRAAGEEMLAYFMRASEGSLMMDLGARSLAGRRAYEKAYKKLLKEGGDALTDLERAHLRYEMPSHVRPLAWMGRKVGWEDPVNQMLNNYGQFMRNSMETGFGLKLETKVDFLDTLFLGRTNSWRRYAASGVDPALMRAGDAWVMRNSRMAMEVTSAMNASLFDRQVVRPDTERVLVTDRRDATKRKEVSIRLTGEHGRIARSGGAAHDERTQRAIHHRVGEFLMDEVIAPVASDMDTRKWEGFADMTKDQFVDALEMVDTHVGDNYSLKILLSELVDPMRDNMAATARQLDNADPALAKALRAAYRDNSFSPDKVIQSLRAEVTKILTQSGARYVGDIADKQLAKQANQLVKIADSMEQLKPLIEAMQSVVEPNTRAFAGAALTRQMFAPPERRYNVADMRAWAGGGLKTAPDRVYYRGVPDPDTFIVNPDGSATFLPQKQAHWDGDMRAVSLTTEPRQALVYAGMASNRKANTGVVIAIDSRAVTDVTGMTHEQILENAAYYGATPEISGDIGAAIMGTGNDLATEVSVVYKNPDGSFTVPAGMWRIEDKEAQARILESSRLRYEAGQADRFDEELANMRPIAGMEPAEIIPSLRQETEAWAATLDGEQTEALEQVVLNYQEMELEYREEYRRNPLISPPSETFEDMILADPLLKDGYTRLLGARMGDGSASFITVRDTIGGTGDPLWNQWADAFAEMLELPQNGQWRNTLDGGFHVNKPSMWSSMFGDVEDLRGAGGWDPSTINPGWSPMYEDTEAWERAFVSEVEAQLLHPENQEYLRTSDRMVSGTDGLPFAQPPDDGLNYIYTPVVPAETTVAQEIANYSMPYGDITDTDMISTITTLRTILDQPARFPEMFLADAIGALSYKLNAAGKVDEARFLDDIGARYYGADWRPLGSEARGTQEIGIEAARGEESYNVAIEPDAELWADLETLLDQLQEPATWRAKAQRLIQRQSTRGNQAEINELLNDVEQLELIGRALRLMTDNPAMYGQPVSIPLHTLGFDDPRIARWITNVLSDTPIEEGAAKVGKTTVPFRSTHGLGAWHDGVRLGDVSPTAGRVWQMDDRYAGNIEALEAMNVHRIPGPTWTNPVTKREEETTTWMVGRSLETAANEYAKTIRDNLLTIHRRGMRERQIVREDSGRKLLRRNGDRYDEVPAGEALHTPEDLFVADDDGMPGDLATFGDNALFRHEAENTSDELMWNILGPMIRDHYEAGAGVSRRVDRPYRTKHHVLSGKTEYIPVESAVDVDQTIVMTRSRVDDVAKEDDAALPNVALAEMYELVPDMVWDRIVRYGFDTVIGPSIDALARKPMTFHYYARAYEENSKQMRWLLNSELFDTHVATEFGDVIAAVSEAGTLTADEIAVARAVAAREGITVKTNEDAARFLMGFGGVSDDGLAVELQRVAEEIRQEEWIEFTRTLTSDQIDTMAMLEAEEMLKESDRFALAQKIDDSAKRLDLLHLRMNNADPNIIGHRSATERLVAGYNDEVPDHIWREGKEAVETYIKKNQIPLHNKFTPDQWRVLRDARDNLRHVHNVIEETATLRAIWNVEPFLDDHAQRSMFGEYARNFIPFWYAEENFIKRWGRTLATSPVLGIDIARKAQLLYMGLKSAGIVRTDTAGQDWVVYPGSGLLQEAIDKTGLWGSTLPIGVLMQARTDSLLPGVNEEMGNISPSPFVAMPVHALTHLFPEMKDTKRALLGEVGASSAIASQFVPSTLTRAWESFFGNEDSSMRFNSALMAAIANAEARGMGLAQNASADDQEEFFDKMRNHARIILMTQMVTGFVVPGAPSAVVSGEDTLSLSSITGLNIDDPGQMLKKVYRDYVTNMGVEEGTFEYLATAGEYADLEDIVEPMALTVSGSTSISGAPLPATRSGMAWYNDHSDWINASPEAGAWFLPPDDGGEDFDYYSYVQQMSSGLRKRRDPNEFLRAIKYRGAADRYFAMKDAHDEAERAAGDNSEMRGAVNDYWANWKNSYLAANPIFSEELQDGSSRQRRKRTIEQMRYAVNDPAAPPSPHIEGIRELVTMYDSYVTARTILADRRDAVSMEKKRQLKEAMRDMVERWKLRYPDLERLWSSTYEPEARLD